MKKIYFIYIFALSCIVQSCEEVIPLDLDTAAPKLVIEASINWKKGSSGSSQKIKLSTTTSYYNNIPSMVLGATVYIKNSNNEIFNFVDGANSGEYKCDNFVPKMGETYQLTVVNNGNNYTATEKFQSVTPINTIVQDNKAGFSGKKIQLKALFNDPAGVSNYYLYRYTYSNQVKADFYVDEDVFFDGNSFFSISQNDDLKSGDKVEISHYGISKTYYNYMNVLVSIAGNSGGGPFQSPPATVRGNIINTTKPEDFPLGYFSLSEYDTMNYVVE
jgi:hypothetical protein